MTGLRSFQRTRIDCFLGGGINDRYYSYNYEGGTYSIEYHCPWYVVSTVYGRLRYTTLEEAETLLFLLLVGLGADRH